GGFLAASHRAGAPRGAGTPRPAAPERAARPGDDLPEMPGKGARPALRQRRRAGGRPGPVPRRQARGSRTPGRDGAAGARSRGRRAGRLAGVAAGDGYQLADEIGRGPRSTVYRARYGALPQPVALKVFRGEVCPRGEWEARLRRDAEPWAGLAHPQIVPVQRI